MSDLGFFKHNGQFANRTNSDLDQGRRDLKLTRYHKLYGETERSCGQYPISVDVSYRTQAKGGGDAALSRTPPIQEGSFHGTRRHT